MSYTADINDGRRPWGDRTWGDRGDRTWGDRDRNDRGDQRDRTWCGPGAHRMHPAGLILLTVLGFMLWWPLGLAMLGFMLWNKSMGWGHGGEHWQRKMERMRDRFGGGFGYTPSSGNRAFDDYRADTLRRLEEEQREFRDFLERLRAAKDKSEFDQFMAERRNRQGPSQDPVSGPSPQP
jgi:hypothetical protein